MIHILVLVGWLISVIISMFVLFWVIIAALDSSDMAKDMKEIKRLLENQSRREKDEQKVNTNSKYNNNIDETESVGTIEECPACNEKVLSTDAICNSCGLTLIINEKKE